MRERIAHHLELSGKDLPAEQILREVLNIHSPNVFAADKVLRGILGSDPRFHHRRGLWGFTPARSDSRHEIAALFLQRSAKDGRFFRGSIFIPAEGANRDFEGTTPTDTETGRALYAASRACANHLLIYWNERTLANWHVLLRSARLPEWTGASLAVSQLADAVFPSESRHRNIEDLAPRLSLPAPEEDSPASLARLLASVYHGLLDLVPQTHKNGSGALAAWMAESRPRVDFSKFAFDRNLLANIPEAPGVYLMRNRAGEVIYVGKAANLRRRVRSYFTPRALRDPKVADIHNQLYSLEFLTSATEVEALVLEMRMIRDFHPLINLQEEVHERQSRYGKDRNLLLLVPVGDKAEVYFIKDGAFLSRLSVPMGASPSKRLTNKVRAVYFGTRKPKAPDREAWETEIVARWLSARRKQLNLIDVDESGSFDSLLRRLACYLKDPDHLAHKVTYL